MRRTGIDVAALRTWWISEAWPSTPVGSQHGDLQHALASAMWAATAGVALDADQDYSADLLTLLDSPVTDTMNPQVLHGILSAALHTRTPYDLICTGYERLRAMSHDPVLWAKTEINQAHIDLARGTYAAVAGDQAWAQTCFERVFARTREAARLLSEAELTSRAQYDVSIYALRTRAHLGLKRWDVALHQALHTASLAAHHAGPFTVHSTRALVGLCAAYDGREDLATAWLQMLASVPDEVAFERDGARAVLLYCTGQLAAAAELADSVLSGWPNRVMRRRNAWMAALLIEVIEGGHA